MKGNIWMGCMAVSQTRKDWACSVVYVMEEMMHLLNREYIHNYNLSVRLYYGQCYRWKSARRLRTSPIIEDSDWVYKALYVTSLSKEIEIVISFKAALSEAGPRAKPGTSRITSILVIVGKRSKCVSLSSSRGTWLCQKLRNGRLEDVTTWASCACVALYLLLSPEKGR